MSLSFSVSTSAPKLAEVQVVFALTGATSGGRNSADGRGGKRNSASKRGADKPNPRFLGDAKLKQARPLLESKGFAGKAKSAELISDDSGQLTAVVGLGDGTSLDDVRDGAAELARLVSGHAAIVCSVELAGGTRQGSGGGTAKSTAPKTIFASCKFEPTQWAKAFAEGLTLGSYQYHDFKSKPAPRKLSKICVVAANQPTAQRTALRHALAEGAAAADAVCFARDLINEPGGTLTPERLANKAKQMAAGSGLSVTVWDMADIKRHKLGGLLGVNRGSDRPARFVKLRWNPPGGSSRANSSRATKSLALVGKGVTFDSGGLSLKTAVGMRNMKYDMSGAAAVLGAMSAVAELKPKCRVTAYLPLTDNMTGGDATRTGDVLTMRNKKTVEVLNTDAEGRLILADALSLACEDSPDAIVDLATLTGACMVALGNGYAGIMGNDQGWVDDVIAAGERAGERLWQLPLPADYRPQLDSPVADMANIGNTNGGGAITAGLFLSEFVSGDIAWAHLDIAGTAFSDKNSGTTTKGGVGFGVRTLLELIEGF